MFNSRGYCEKCMKFQDYTESSIELVKDFNIGRIKYNCYKAICSVCSEEIYEPKINMKNKKELNKKIKELEEELNILEMLKKIKGAKVIKNASDEELLDEIKSIFSDKKRDW